MSEGLKLYIWVREIVKGRYKKIERYSLTEGFPSPPKALPPTAARPVNVDGRLKGSVSKIGKEEMWSGTCE